MNAIFAQIKRRLLNWSLRKFERQLERERVTADKVEGLFQQLSTLSGGYKKLEKVCPFAHPDIAADLDLIVSLYGRIITLSQEHEVAAIVQKAEALNAKIAHSPCSLLAQEVDALKDHIYTFCRDNRPSKEGRDLLSKARRAARLGEATLKNSENLNGSPLAEYSEEEAEDLLECAFFYHVGTPQLATPLFNALPQTITKRCLDYIEEIGGEPLALEGHSLKWQQALIRTAFVISDEGATDRFLAQHEIAALFEERASLQ